MASLPTGSEHWRRLAELAKQAPSLSIAKLCEAPGRLAGYSLEVGGVYADFTRNLATDEILAELRALAQEAEVMPLLQAMANGEAVNTSEERPALHLALRLPSPGIAPSLKRQFADTTVQLHKASQAIRKGSWRGATGKPFTDVINIGIGGSDLGPKMVCAALRPYAAEAPRLHFISNVDGAEIRALLAALNPKTTLVIISSKSFTTAETLRNADTALDWLAKGLNLPAPAASAHVIGITASPKKALAFGIKPERLLTFAEGIGGRYSLWSAIGLPTAIALGPERHAELLKGASAMDAHFLKAGYRSLPMTLALLRLWHGNFLGYRTQAVVPYCERLGLLVPYLQQLDMESNGKSAHRSGAPVALDTGPVIWGQTGTNCQHAFFQSLHQGTQTVPVDFIGLSQDPASLPEHHRQLNANMIAQADALAAGKPEAQGHQRYPGNRPSTVLLLDELSPYTLGSLIALYEHIVFVQAAIWQINPFDQWGVELGKTLATQILAGKASPSPATAELLRRTQL